MKKNLLFTLFLLLVVATAFAQRQFRFKDGKFKVTKVADKIFVGKNILHVQIARMRHHA